MAGPRVRPPFDACDAHVVRRVVRAASKKASTASEFNGDLAPWDRRNINPSTIFGSRAEPPRRTSCSARTKLVHR